MTENFLDILVYVPARETFIVMSEGTGDNLLDEDYEMGLKDYIIYDYFGLDEVLDRKINMIGGMVMYPYLIQEKHDDLADYIEDVVMDIFDTDVGELKYQIIGRG